MDDDQHYDDSEPADVVQLSGRQFMSMLDEPSDSQATSQYLIDEPKKVTFMYIVQCACTVSTRILQAKGMINFTIIQRVHNDENSI